MTPKLETRLFCFAFTFLWLWGLVTPCLATVTRRDAPVANTTLGQVRGVVDYSRNNKQYYKYMGIPYAEPPVGPLRFEAPIPWKEPWDGVRAADNWGSPCLQFDAILRGRVLGEEDCLFINIFTKELNPPTSVPVLAWVHGGGFVAGSSDMYDPKYILDHDVVVVTFNYRLASLGFLNTGDEFIRGNMGLKDQNLALRFIRDNIRNFGGNPNQVTLFGESAGAASVHFHVISPLSKGLFHKAIMQSGNVYCPWALTRNPSNQAKYFGKNIGCPTDNSSVLVNCLKQMEGKDIVAEHHKILSPVHTQDDFFPGSVEAVQMDDTFLVENPFMMIERGDFNRVPAIFGVNSGEGALKTARIEATPDIMNSLDHKWDEHVAILLHFNPEMRNVSEKVRHFYCPETVIIPGEEHNSNSRVLPQNALENVTHMISDGVWYHATRKAALHHAKFAPTYLNYFSYHSSVLPSSYTFIKSARKRDNIPAEFSWPRYFIEAYINQLFFQDRNPKRFGACHGDDLMYYWSTNPILQIRTISQDYDFSKNFVNSIVQFTSEDNSTLKFADIDWDPVNPNGTIMYMRLDRNAEMIEQPFQDRLDFFDSLNIRDPLDPNNW